ncbi:MAG TPA: recombinase family protein [Candidatus Aquilonibacter sp.]|nr:recombinase family protein [Candidatus Aquilonibacter sp.]
MRRAAQYVRMSTDQQPLSPEYQRAVIQRYAEERGIAIVRTYLDEAKSGLTLRERGALRQLLDDTKSGQADYELVLVYDVSRWGRFQDPDESAYYEFLCRSHGIDVAYCSEPFENDRSILANIVKSLKRSMAGEYSRELSAKVTTSQHRVAAKGFHAAGAAGYGLRRMMVDKEGRHVLLLRNGQRKFGREWRTVLVRGPEDEIAVIKRIYSLYLRRGLTQQQIADILNAEGVYNEFGRPWLRGTVNAILTNPKYTGDIVYNRTTSKLHMRTRHNAPEKWLHIKAAFKPVVAKEMQEAVFARRRSLSAYRHTRESLAAHLRDLWKRRGYLTSEMMKDEPGFPCPRTYVNHFGSLMAAYRYIGYSPSQCCLYRDEERRVREMRGEFLIAIAETGRGRDIEVEADEDAGLLRFGGEFTAKVIVARSFRRRSESPRLWWYSNLSSKCTADIAVIGRLDEANEAIKDYYFIPRRLFAVVGNRMTSDNGAAIDAFRFTNLDPLFTVLDRVSWLEALI